MPISVFPFPLIKSHMRTRILLCQFWPSGIAVACVCVRVCMCQSVCQSLVRVITQDLFKLGSPNLDQDEKKPWLRCLLFRGAIGGGRTFKVQFDKKKKSTNLSHFELVYTITHRLLKLQSPNLDLRCKTSWLRSLLFWGLIDVDLPTKLICTVFVLYIVRPPL